MKDRCMTKKSICAVCKEKITTGAYNCSTKESLCWACYRVRMDREQKSYILSDEDWLFGRIYLWIRKIFGGRHD